VPGKQKLIKNQKTNKMSNTFTMVEVPVRKKSKIAIRPYVDRTIENMGLEKAGLALYDGVVHYEQLACLENNGIIRYLTGLNEFAPEIKTLPVEMRDARIKHIRSAVSELEKELASNVIDPEDKDFWNKVQLLRPNNSEFWNKIIIQCGNEPVYLDENNPYDRIKLYAIEAGGFDIVAKSYEDAKSKSKPPKFYLDKEEETVSTRTEYKKLRNKALGMLEKLYNSNQTKLFYIAKAVDITSVQYKKNTPIDIIYENMDKHINGEGGESNKERAVKSFSDAANSDMATLKLRAIVKDASYYKLIATKSDGHFYHMKSGSVIGRNVSDVIEFLKNPINDDVFKDLNEEVEKLWNI
jgi:hypothetical protein